MPEFLWVGETECATCMSLRSKTLPQFPGKDKGLKLLGPHPGGPMRRIYKKEDSTTNC